MKPPTLIFLLGCATLALVGCGTIARLVGTTVAISGVLTTGRDGTPVPNVQVAVGGMYVESPLSFLPSIRPLAAPTSDAAGRFTCVVPYYRSYHLRVSSKEWTYWQFIERSAFGSEPLHIKLNSRAEVDAQLHEAERRNAPATTTTSAPADAKLLP